MNLHGYKLQENESINKSLYSNLSISVETELMYKIKSFAQSKDMTCQDLFKDSVLTYIQQKENCSNSSIQ